MNVNDDDMNQVQGHTDLASVSILDCAIVEVLGTRSEDSNTMNDEERSSARTDRPRNSLDS